MTFPTLQNWKKNVPDSLTCSIPSQQVKKTKQKQNKRKGKKARATRIEANCKRVVETIAPHQESHHVTEPIGPLSLHYEGISGLLTTQRPYIQYAFEKGLFTNESQDIIKQYLRFNLNENHDDDESDCINVKLIK